VYRETCAVFLRTYYVDDSVMNIVYREIIAVFLNPYKTYVLRVKVIEMNVLYEKLVLFFHIPTEHTY
jgi:hypothetical protein